MMDVGYPLHLGDLLAKLYMKQHANVKSCGNTNVQPREKTLNRF